MAADWITFRKNMKLELGTPNQLSISQLSEIHADEYANAVKTASVIFTGSEATVGINTDIIKAGFNSVFTKLSKETVEILPNYKNDKPTDNELESRDKLENIFLPIALAITAEWQKEVFTPSVVPTIPISYVSPTTGYQVLIPGDPFNFAKDLAKAFFIAQTELNQEIAFNVFIKSLIFAYTEHLLKISGVFNGLVPAAPNPIPGPPFPWIGVI
jgi:hypothetical protein